MADPLIHLRRVLLDPAKHAWRRWIHRRPIVWIGLTGGIAAGKSTVAELLKTAGLRVVDLDRIARECLQTDSNLRHRIGELSQLELDRFDAPKRSALRDKLFSDADLRRRVEREIHPIVYGEFEQIANRAAQDGEPAIVCEAALLVETGFHKKMDFLVVVAAPETDRRKRLVDRDSIDDELVGRILLAQANEIERYRAADRILENNSSPEDLERRSLWLVEEFKQKGWLRSSPRVQ